MNHSPSALSLQLRAAPLALALLVMGPPTPAPAQGTGASVAFRDVRLFDGGQVHDRTTVLVVDGLIASVGAVIAIPADATVIDGTGHTLLPGLIDSHVHVFGPALEQALMFGVTTVLDMFTEPNSAAQLKREQTSSGALDRADLYSAGVLVTAPGGHGTEYGLPIPTISGPGEAQAFVDDRIAEGSDYIKIVYDADAVHTGAMPSIDQLTLRAVIEAAHNRSKLALVHITDLKSARDAIEAGANGLVHLFTDTLPDPGFGQFAADHGVFVIPTMTVLQSAAGMSSGAELAEDPWLAAFLTPDQTTNLRRRFTTRDDSVEVYAAAPATLLQLKASGALILAGSDAPNLGTAHGASVHRELKLLVDAGLTPVEALAAATSVPAQAFGLLDRGRVAAGQRADLLLVRGDPTSDITRTRDILGVWKLGVPVDRAAYGAELARRGAERERRATTGGAEIGLVSDFDGEEASAEFGFGWQLSTDAIAGGQSTGEIHVDEDAADGTDGSLAVRGTIAPGLPFAWAGAMFFPGDQPFSPADMSAKSGIAFWAKGDGKTYRLMIFAESLGQIPATQTFVAGPDWTEFRFSLSDFAGADASGLLGILFAGGPAPGDFEFQIDEVWFR